MGNRRLGLKRIEALLEAVDRDLNLANSTLTNCIITTNAAVTLSGTNTLSGVSVSTNTVGLRDARSFRCAATVGAARTSLTATTLAVNTHYDGGTATNLAMLIPSAAATSIGDWITVFYTSVINNTQTHTYTTTTDTAFAPGSLILRQGQGIAGAADVATTNDNILTLAGDTNGDCGIGTVVRFVNTTGATNGWAVEAVIVNQGNGSEAMGSAFS